MGIFFRAFSHIKSGINTRDYYKSMNKALQRLNEDYTMLHYPFHISDNDGFLDAQTNLTDFCMSLLPSVDEKQLLEVGCGNGVQAIYIHEEYHPGHIMAIDLNHGNIEIAKKEAERKNVKKIQFHVDDAHELATIKKDSIDFVLSIESAFHYPDKPAFLREIHRVLKPGGKVLIADILTTNRRNNNLKDRWKKKMSYNHWPLESYETELPLANIHIESVSDITSQMIQGFSNYRRWLREMKKKHFLEDLLMKAYYSIHVRINMHLLRTRRQYCVIVGSKPYLS